MIPFRRGTVLSGSQVASSQVRPLTGGEMEAAAEREVWLKRTKRIEQIAGVLAVLGAAAGAAMGSKRVKMVCDLAIPALALLAFVFRKRMSNEPS